MVVASLIAVFAVGAIASGPAFAAKSPWTVNTWGQYKYCDYETELPGEGNEFCFAGITNGGSKGGFFEFGKVKVKLNKPITLQGSFTGPASALEVYPAGNGGTSLEAPPLKVIGGIGLFTKAIQEDNEWPAALRESYREAKKNKETAVYAKIEMAGTECFTVPGCLNTTNILFEEGTAFRLPLKVTVTSPWLEKLGGGPCQIGNDENPIHINLTTADSGAAGELKQNAEFKQIVLANSRLVDVGWHIEEGSYPKGCGGAYESTVDHSLNEVLEVAEWKTGIVVLTGSLFTGRKDHVIEEGFAKGELP